MNKEFMQVNLTYFKNSGKYYTSESYFSVFSTLHEIIDEIQDMLLVKNFPGLSTNDWDGYILIETPIGKHLLDITI